MRKMRTALGVLGLVAGLLTTACSPWENAVVARLAQIDPAKAQEVMNSVPQDQWFNGEPMMLPTPDVTGDCSQWAYTALTSGFSVEQWNSIVNWVMHGESTCDPNAHNRSGATGLMQVMPGHTGDGSLCGGTPAMLYDPSFNLQCAYLVWATEGWSAWQVYTNQRGSG